MMNPTAKAVESSTAGTLRRVRVSEGWHTSKHFDFGSRQLLMSRTISLFALCHIVLHVLKSVN